MSLTSLGTSFANRYANAPTGDIELHQVAPQNGGARAVQNVAQPLPSTSGTAASSSTLSDDLKALSDFIPSEIVTFYIAAIAAVKGYAFIANGQAATGAALTQLQAPFLMWIFIASIVAAPIWEFFAVFLASRAMPPARAYIWPMIAAPVAFVTYAIAIPGSWLAEQIHYGALFATIALLVITPVLLGLTKVYLKLFPPLAAP